MLPPRTIQLVVGLAAAASLVLPSSSASAAQGKRITHELTSNHLARPRSLTVALPGSYSNQSGFDYPVLYLLDGETNLDHVAAVTAFLAETGVMPEVILVGVHAGTTRAQDYVPPASRDGAPGGRADAFLDFMESELLPFIEAEYRAAPMRIVSGHSLGGLMVTYAAFLHPGLFDIHLAQSPYLDDPLGTPLVEEIEARAPVGGGDSDLYYFANLGDEAELEPNFHRLSALLADESTAVLGGTRREPGASHMGTRLVGLYDGLHAYFKPVWSFDEGVSDGGEGGFLAFLDSLESRFGFPVLYSEAGFQREAQALLQERKATEATAVSKRYVSQYPATPVSHFLLGNALAARGDRDAAVAAIRRAIELYEAEPDPAMAPLHQAMQRLLANLGGGPAAEGGPS